MTVWLIVGIITLAFLGEAMFGFGGGLIAVPLLSLLLGVKEAVTLVLIFQVLMGFLLIRCYRDIAWKVVGMLSVGLIIGLAIGTVSLVMVKESILRLILAAFIFLFLTKTFFFNDLSFKKGSGGFLGSIAGALGGLFQGMIGTGGPPLVMFLSELKMEKEAFRATLILLLFACNVLRVIAYGSMGLFTGPILEASLPALPFFGVALVVGHRIHHLISEKVYRYSVYTLLFVAAVSLALKGLLA